MAIGAERVLTQRELSRALLERQFLLARRREGLPRALERLGGIQAQYAPSMYIGLWSRLADFERDSLTRALERRTVIQATLMRSTIHLVSARDYWPFAAGTRDARWESWQRAYKRGPTARQALAAARRVERKLADGPRTRAELLKGIDGPRFGGASTRLDLVRIPPSGTWERRRADLYGRAEDWLGPAPPTSEDEGIDLLIRRYLRAFGPASVADVASWAGMQITPVKAALERIEAARRSRCAAEPPEGVRANARLARGLGRRSPGPLGGLRGRAVPRIAVAREEHPGVRARDHVQ